ncbi:MAG: CoA ester lyase [Bacilli bacterium]|nr:CoA ester lyase [Bacilli bacterium]MBN2695912.1 CoA ester lyase [Bacilli bacterium]
MLRSLLFVPGNNPAMIQNADVFGSDAVIFDLEDSVHVAEKDNARNLISEYLETYPVLPDVVIIRINSLDTPFWEADLDAVVSKSVDWIMLPKAGVEEIKKLTLKLESIEKIKQIEKTIKIMPIIELASSLVDLENIAKQERVKGVLFGAEDYRADMGIKRSDTGVELLYPRSRIAVVAKASMIEAIDTPFVDVMNDTALISDCHNASALGMTGKAAIHPRQVMTINDSFSPPKDQIEWASKVMKAKRQADEKNLGVFSLDGKMIDKPIIARAESILKIAKEYGIGGEADD